MQKIQKFQLNRIYATPKSTKTYEPIDRNGHLLTFRVRNPQNRDSWKQLSTSTYKADQTGAFEEVLFSDGICLRADSLRERIRQMPRCKSIQSQLLDSVA